VLYVCEFVGAGDLGGLAEEGAELEGFADGHCCEVEILLLDVADAVLEGGVGCKAVDMGVSGYDTHCYAGCEDVEKGRFTSARHALKSQLSHRQAVGERERTIKAVDLPGLTHPST
jgi:hypothetical protein